MHYIPIPLPAAKRQRFECLSPGIGLPGSPIDVSSPVTDTDFDQATAEPVKDEVEEDSDKAKAEQDDEVKKEPEAEVVEEEVATAEEPWRRPALRRQDN